MDFTPGERIDNGLDMPGRRPTMDVEMFRDRLAVTLDTFGFGPTQGYASSIGSGRYAVEITDDIHP